MSEETTPTRLVERFVEEVLNGADLNVLDDIADPDYVLHVAGFGDFVGLPAVKQFYATTAGAFGDLHVEITRSLANDREVFALFASGGTNTGSAIGMPPTNKRASWSGAGHFRAENGRLVESTNIEDMLGVLTQLGAITLPA